MHPAMHQMHQMIDWWQSRRGGCGDWASCDPSSGGRRGGWGHGQDSGGGFGDGDGDGTGGPFGVRRPLRFLAYKLDLNEQQVAELARILDELKTERAQAEVDRRRTVSAFADAVAGESFDAGKAGEGAKLRVTSAERLRDAVMKALQQIHAMLDPEQRAKLAYLIRTGTLSI
jgi:Spy/CpxP family protein refolding chaperone